ncbi:hypothetical protein [Cobetia crustatorum]|uniref:hypothetical protein n=1 Tax=Cobetia crustatorum TaxID=553385 RepID=UPI0004698151|nr:hypothetical protein [Cobetia crustatorum]
MTQKATHTSHTEHLTEEIKHLEGRLQQTDPNQDPTLYRSLYCMISLRQMQIMAYASSQAEQQRRHVG